MKPVIKRVLLGVLGVVVLGGVGLGIFVKSKTSAFDDSMEKVYDVPLTKVTVSTDPLVLARGKHVVDALTACSSNDCHGKDLAGGTTIKMGPVMTATAPNITSKGMGAVYNDAELFRLFRHGIKKDGRSVRFMPVVEFSWLPEADIVAIISYMRSLPGVDKANGVMEIGTVGKVLDRKGQFALDIARRIDHTKVETVPAPSATAEYGSFLIRMCTGCHGEGLSGGPLPGAPSDMAIPRNITPDATGLKGWTFEDFDKTLTTGVSRDGKKLAALMPVDSFGQMDPMEKKALYAYLLSVPALPFGGR